jgi:2,4-dienoyl-CoA reductase-like NADH-dependent reductase (Old Yellow Enzyme family)
MCQYSRRRRNINDWHRVHLAGLARGGAGLVVVEATAVSPEGRISPGCTGLWNDEQAEALGPVVAAIQGAGAVPGIQIAHAGRKASANRPWEGDDHLPEGDPRGWQTLGPSAVAFGANLPRVPREMTLDDIARVKADFVAAAIRARDVPASSGSNCTSPTGTWPRASSRCIRTTADDQYGGSLENRCRFLLETLAAVRAVWPERLPLTARFGVIEFDGRDEETLAESIELARGFKQGGLDLLSVSIGFSTPGGQNPLGPAFLVPIAGRVRRESGLRVASSWGIDTPHSPKQAVATGQLDQVLVGRAHLGQPALALPPRGALELKG